MNARKRADELDEQLERDLSAWIGAQRGDSAAFRAGVERRTAQAERERNAGGEQGGHAGDAAQAHGTHVDFGARTALSPDEAFDGARAPRAVEPAPWVRKVAACLPPDFGALLLASGKGLSAALLLPALMFGAAFGAFFAGRRSIQRSAREAAPTPTEQPRDVRNLVAHAGSARLVALAQAAIPLSGFAIAFAPFLFGGQLAVDVLVGVVTVAMLLLAVQVRGLARAGLLERRLVVQVCVAALMHLVCSCFLWIQSLQLEAPRSLSTSVTGLVGVLGAMGLIVWQRRSIPLWGLVLGGIAPAALLVTPRATEPAQRLRDFVTAAKVQASELGDWSAVDAAVATLRACDEPAPDLERLRAEIQRALEDGINAHPVVWTAAARLGLVSDEQWRQLATRRLESYRLTQLLSRSEPLSLNDHDEYQLHMLLATRSLSSEERLHLAERVDLSWPALDAKLALEPTLACVRWLDLLGHGERVDARREQLHALVLRHWVAPERGGRSSGGFADLPETHPTSSAPPTFAAVQLMARIGVPAGLDVGLLQDRLRRQTRRTLVFSPSLLAHRALDYAALLRLERQIDVPELSWFERLIAERVLLAVVLILALCVYAIRAAPERDPFALAAGAPR